MDLYEIKVEYSQYEDSGFFIECVFEALRHKKPTHIRYFIKSHFKQYDNCSYIQMRHCGAHWNKVAFTKLNEYDFKNYVNSLMSSANYRMTAKVMEMYLNDVI